jgi:hypothetical protein
MQLPYSFYIIPYSEWAVIQPPLSPDACPLLFNFPTLQLLILPHPQHACGQGDHGAEQLKNPLDSNTQQAERQHQQPDNGEKQQAQQSQGPTEKRQYQPDQEGTHLDSPLDYETIRPGEKFPQGMES